MNFSRQAFCLTSFKSSQAGLKVRSRWPDTSDFHSPIPSLVPRTKFTPPSSYFKSVIALFQTLDQRKSHTGSTARVKRCSHRSTVSSCRLCRWSSWNSTRRSRSTCWIHCICVCCSLSFARDIDPDSPIVNIISQTMNKHVFPGTRLRIGGKRRKKSASEASRAVVWGGERVTEPGDKPLMPPIRPPAINLSLKFQHVKFSSRMSAWAYCKKYAIFTFARMK